MKANQKFMKADEAVSPVIGVILMVAITVVLAAVVFVLVSDLGDTGDQTPQITLTKSGAGENAVLTVQRAPVNLEWNEFTISVSPAACDVLAQPSTADEVTAGNTITFQDDGAGDDDCIGAEVSIVHLATNGVAARATL